MKKCPHCTQQLRGTHEILAVAFPQGDELELVHALLDGRSKSRATLGEAVFGSYRSLTSEYNSLAQIVKRVNRRLSRSGYKIISDRGVGYRLMRSIQFA